LDSVKGDRFGTSVSISGNLVVVGSPLADISGTKDAGAAYLFRRSGSSWSQETKLVRATRATTDRFGDSVAAIGDFVAVGCPLANVNGVTDSGEVSVFQRQSLVWSLRSSFTSVPVTASDRFGQSVALGGNAAMPVLVAGAPGDDQTGASNCGAVYVGPLDAEGSAASTTRLVAMAPSASAALGTGVAIDASGTRVAGGAPLAGVAGVGAKAGLVTVWEQSGNSWTAATLTPAGQSADEQFGSCLAFGPDREWLVAGSPLRTVGGVAGRGAATVFRSTSGAWSTWDRLTLPPVGTGASNFGRGAAFAGGTVLIGAPKHNSKGSVREFAVTP
jgi:hypothetical protein